MFFETKDSFVLVVGRFELKKKKKKTESGWLADFNNKNSVNNIMITIVNYRVELGSSSLHINRTRICQLELLFPMQTC